VRIAVTGAAGRVGRSVTELASSEGHTVVAIDRRAADPAIAASRFERIDVTDFSALVDAISGCDALIHLAAIPGPGMLPDHIVHDTNVVSSYHALRAASEVGIRRICQASSINAIGGRFSRWPRYDYFPLDERHPTYAEDPYSLSKWVCERQADAMARLDPDLSIASLRLHGVVHSRTETIGWVDTPDRIAEKQLWGYVRFPAAARAFLTGVTTDLGGHEVFYIVSPYTMVDTPSLTLAAEHYPEVPVRGDLSGTRGFFDCAKAESMLGWIHDAE